VLGPAAIANVDGWSINLANLHDAVAQIVGSAKRAESFAVFTLNLDHLYKLRHSPPFREAYTKARYVTADGAPVAWLASFGSPSVQRTAGADLIVPLVQAAASENIGIYLYGTTPAVLEKASAHLSRHAGADLKIVGVASPPQGFDPCGSVADTALDRISASGARICFVALGAPKQELFAAQAVQRNVPAGFVCIGAGLDFIAGAQSRAPALMQRWGVEWLWRLITNPRRLGVRYARCAVLFIRILAVSALRKQNAAS